MTQVNETEKCAGRILVVDDHATDRLKLAMALKRLGHQVESASDGPEALAMMGETDFDLVLLDLLMPGMDGFEVLETMKYNQRLQKTPVIVVSSLDDSESIDKATALGAAGHLSKSFVPDQLEARLSTYLKVRGDGQEER